MGAYGRVELQQGTGKTTTCEAHDTIELPLFERTGNSFLSHNTLYLKVHTMSKVIVASSIAIGFIIVAIASGAEAAGVGTAEWECENFGTNCKSLSVYIPDGQDNPKNPEDTYPIN